MKCPNCGAEIGKSKICEFCGAQISYDMQREQEQLNKKGCPKCGSSNIQFRRENQGEVRGKNNKRVIHRTVGFCKDCGHTWYPSGSNDAPAKNNMVWWVLGWIFFFPAPVMVLIWRKKNTWDIKIKIAVTVVFWILIFVLGSCGDGSDKASKDTKASVEESTQRMGDAPSENNTASISVENNVDSTDESTEVNAYDAIDKCYEELSANNNSTNWNELSKQLKELADKYGLYQDSKNNGLGTRYAKIATSRDEAKVISNSDLDKGTYYIRIVADFSKGSPEIQLIDNLSNTGEDSEETTQGERYSEDDKVNRFIEEYNAVTRYEMTDFDKGNIRSKMYGHTNDCRVEMLNPASTSDYSFIVKIYGGNNEEITEKMNDVFPDFIHTLDSSITDEQIEEAITAFKNDPSSRREYKLGNDLIIDYFPLVFKDDGSWLSDSRIEISSLNYGN